ncbi:MAG: FAD/NAD(P)-binding protein [Sedimentisphaerales bacterium]|nr:FAD/NAD(P)-binding protein [Sedimentisphaerales bacterium]
MITSNPYLPMETELLEVIDETPTIKTLVLKPREPIPFRAGQFMQLTLPGVGEAPFTPSSNPRDADRQEITILKTGQVTDRLHDAAPGDLLGLRGPFGKGYPLEKFHGKEVLLVGGGVGLAPLRALIYALGNEPKKFRRVSIKYGARRPAERLYPGQYEQWRGIDNFDFTETVDVAEDGWKGNVGVVTTLLPDDLDIDRTNAYVVSCGPPIMLRFVTLRCLELGFTPAQIYLSLNRKMSCGFGVCGRCNIGPYYLCKDGPDMCYEKIMHYDNVF